MQGSYMGSFTEREEFPSLFFKSHLKLRMGGSRSSLASKLLTDTIKQPRQRRTSAVSSQERDTQSPDSQSLDLWSTASSFSSSDSSDIVRIVGRGGAGARRRTYPKEQQYTNIVRPPTPPVHTDPQEPSNLPDATAFRTIGRGGLGSRPRRKHGKSKSTSSTRQPTEMEVVVMRKLSKKRKDPLYVDELASTISSIHFAGETGQPPPDFFCTGTGRKPSKDPSDEIEESPANRQGQDFTNSQDKCQLSQNPYNSSRSPDKIYRTLGDLPNADALMKDQASNLRWKRKSKRRDRLSLLFSIFHSTTSGTRKSTMAHGASHSSIPSQLTLTSIETNPSYFFHGSFSPPSTPLCLTDSIGHSDELSGSARLPSLRKETSASSNPKYDATEVNGENNHESTIAPPPPPPLPRLKHNPPLRQQRELLRISPSEAGALFGPPISLSDTPFATGDEGSSRDASPLPPPMINDLDDTIVTTPGVEKQMTWTGEWNIGLEDVISALRALR